MTTLRAMIRKSLKSNPDKIALIEGERQYTFREFADRTRRMGNALLQNLGLEKGERVAILSRNSMENAESYFSIPNAALVLVMLNFRLAPPEILNILSDAGASVLIVEESFLDALSQIRDQLSFIRHFILIGDAPLPNGWYGYESLIECSPAHEPDVELKQNDLAALMYTSGTTGLPKGCMATHQNFYFVGQSKTEVMKMREDDCGIVTTPLFHASGEVVLMTGIYSTMTTIIMPRWDVLEFSRLVEKHQVTTGVLATPMLLYLLSCPNIEDHKLSSLKRILFAGAPVTPEIFQKAIKRFGNIFVHGYGTTETVGSICILETKEVDTALKQGHTEILSSCGKAYAGMDIEVVDGAGNPVATGQSGELRTRGPGMTKGYWNKIEETQKTFRNGWFHSGDLCRKDDWGFVYIVGRKKDVIITGAENVFPAEIENILYQHPGIQEAVVVGMDNAKWGEIVTAFVVPQPGFQLNSEEVIGFCREVTAGYKIPKKVFFIENFPMSATGKVLRHELKEQFSSESIFHL